MGFGHVGLRFWFGVEDNRNEDVPGGGDSAGLDEGRGKTDCGKRIVQCHHSRDFGSGWAKERIGAAVPL